MPSKFTHLHTHSHYSLLSALPKIDELVAYAKECGMSALALTDNGNLYGAIEFYKECQKVGIKPIIGVDAYVAVRTRKDKQAGIDNRRTRMVLLAENDTGYHNLIKLVTVSHLEGFYYKPRIDRELMEKYREGLICISPSISGAISLALKSKNLEKATEEALWLQKVYGKENFFLETTHHPEIEGHEDTMLSLASLAKKLNIPLVAAHDVYYLKPEDKKARNTLELVNTNGDLSDRSDDGADFSFIDGKTAGEFFRHIPEAIENSVKIADRINLKLEFGRWVFPNYPVQGGLSYDQELERLVYEGIKRREIEKSPEIEKRIEYELSVIKNKGYAPYFLVVSDLLRYAHEKGILTTIRGSVAGSMVTYLAGITNVNPIDYKLPFERFLNPERPSAPDIDMDYADNRRDEMIEYAKKKYGADKVAQIGTFGTMMARGAVRDVSRALGFPYSKGDEIAKLIPFGQQGFPMSIDRAIKETPDLEKLYEKDADTKTIIDMAKKIEGCARHISVHAAGVVISPKPLIEYIPLQLDPKGENKIITQYDMHAVEDAGLLKFDFLGIKNLSILADAVERVKKIENIDVDIENIPLDDKKTFEMLTKGETIGLFQLNGSGMTRFLKELSPTSIFDINAMVALYRPGPMESIPQYIERKHNPKLVKYLDPRLKDILDQSYGVITYQDDVMMIAIKLAGYSWLEADKLRKAMGKKIPKEMEGEKGKLLEGFVKNGLSKEKAEIFWKLIEPFAAYGFNKAHAASYGRVAYQTSYMKANFPEIYMSAVLTADSGEIEKIAETITECKRMGIPVLPPSVNESYSQFTVIKSDAHPYKIRFGLVTIKNFGQGVSTSIIEERKKGGPFKSLEDFLSRVHDRNLNKKSLEALIKAGALDDFGERGRMFINMENLLRYNKEQTSGPKSQDSLFIGTAGSNLSGLTLSEAKPARLEERLAWEKELLGLYISGHPLDKYQSLFEKRDLNIAKVRTEPKEGLTVVLGGIIEGPRIISTKGGDMMMFLKLTDLSGIIECVVFPKIYAEYKDMLLPETIIAVKGRISTRNGEVSLIAEKIKRLQ